MKHSPQSSNNVSTTPLACKAGHFCPEEAIFFIQPNARQGACLPFNSKTMHTWESGVLTKNCAKQGMESLHTSLSVNLWIKKRTKYLQTSTSQLDRVLPTLLCPKACVQFWQPRGISGVWLPSLGLSARDSCPAGHFCPMTSQKVECDEGSYAPPGRPP